MKPETHYAIGMICELVRYGKMTSNELAERLEIEPSYVLHVLKKLKEKDVLISTQGVQGGIKVKQGIEKKGVLEIVEILEPTTKINRCLEEDCYCSRNATQFCPVRKIYVKMQEKIETRLNQYTIEDLIKYEIEKERNQENSGMNQSNHRGFCDGMKQEVENSVR